jgi:hypothetical protein
MPRIYSASIPAARLAVPQLTRNRPSGLSPFRFIDVDFSPRRLHDGRDWEETGRFTSFAANFLLSLLDARKSAPSLRSTHREQSRNFSRCSRQWSRLTVAHKMSLKLLGTVTLHFASQTSCLASHRDLPTRNTLLASYRGLAS